MTGGEQSAAHTVYAGMRAAIIGGAYVPGAVLSRPLIAEQYGTSQMPVREAFLRLEEDGLLTVRPQVPTVVAAIRVLEVHQAHFLKRSLTGEVVRSLARKPERRELGAVRATLQGLGEARFAEGLDEVHAALFEAVGMFAVLLKTRALLVPLERCRALVPVDTGRVARARMELEDVLGRIEAGDPEGSVRAMESHLISDVAELERLRRDRPAFFDGD